MILAELHNIIKQSVSGYSYYIITAIAITGLILRAIRFRKKGLFLYDEAAYFREAIAAKLHFRFIKNHWREFVALKNQSDEKAAELLEKQYYQEVHTHYAYYKPWLLYLNLISLKFIKQRDVAVTASQLLLGTLSIFLIYYLGLMAFGPATGIAAAIMLAFSGLHILHSRSAEPEIGVTFCYMIAIILSVTEKTLSGGVSRSLSAESFLLIYTCGFFYAGILMFNPVWMPVIFVLIFVTELVWTVAAGAAAVSFALTLIIIFFGMITCLIITDFLFITTYLIYPKGIVYPHTFRFVRLVSYILFALKDRIKKSGDLGVKLSPWFKFTFYPSVMMHTEGVAAIAGAVTGVVLMIVNGADTNLYIATHGLLLSAFLILVPQKATRGLVIFLPFLCLFAGYTTSSAPAWAAAAFLIWTSARGIRYALRISRLTSGIRLAYEFIQKKGTDRFATTSIPFSSLYGPEDFRLPRAGLFESLVDAMSHSDVKYLIIDHHEHFPSLMCDDTILLIQEFFEPVFIAEDPCVTFYPLRAECEYYTPTSISFGSNTDVSKWNKFRTKPEDKDKWVRVYDLREFFSGIEKPGLREKLLMMQAEKAIKSEQYEKALGFLTRAREWLPDDPMIGLSIGVCYNNLGDPLSAIRIFRCYQKKPGLSDYIRSEFHVKALYLETEKLIGDSKYEEAFPKATELVQLLSDDPMAKFFLGACMLKLCSREEAITIFREIVDDENLPDYLRRSLKEILAND